MDIKPFVINNTTPVCSFDNGTGFRERYRTDLDSPNSDLVTMPELPDSRMWHDCVVAEVDGVRGQPSPILVCLSLSSIVYTAIPSRP